MSFNEIICRQIEKDKGLEHKSMTPVAIFTSVEFSKTNIAEHSGERHESYEESEINDLNDVLFKGKCILIHPSYALEQAYFSEPIENLTVKDIQEQADKGIAFSGDDHHVFLESLKIIHEQDVQQYLDMICTDKKASDFEGITLIDMCLSS